MGLLGSGAIRINFAISSFLLIEDVHKSSICYYVLLVHGRNLMCFEAGITAANAAAAAAAQNLPFLPLLKTDLQKL